MLSGGNAKRPKRMAITRGSRSESASAQGSNRIRFSAGLESDPEDAAAWGLLADLSWDAARGIRPAVDATEYIALATSAAKEALKRDPSSPLGLLALGSASVFGGMVLAQPMDRAIEMLERALASGALEARQRRRAYFFLARAHQMEERDADSDRCYRKIFPAPLRFLYPLLRARLRAYP